MPADREGAESSLEEQYAEIYSANLPSVPAYDDCYKIILTLDEPRAEAAGGGTFRLLRLTTSSGATVLVLDVLGMAVGEKAQGCGAGSMLVGALKAIVRKEAMTTGAHAVLLTQADNECLPFWEKNGFAMAIEAPALVHTLRAWDPEGAVVFTGATPMALALGGGARLGARAAKRARTGWIDS